MASNRICASVLASGVSSRFGDGSKLLQHFNGFPLIDLVINALARTGEISEIVVIIRPDDHNLKAILSTRDVRIVQNSNFEEGISAAIRVAVKEAQGFDCLLICPAHMPWLTTDSIQRLCLAWLSVGNPGISATIADGHLRSPAIFGSDWFTKLLKCKGDQGAKWILEEYRAFVVPVEISSQELVDIDVREEVKRN